MIRTVFVRPEAEQDLAVACAWYERRQSGLGGQFLDEVAMAMQELARAPDQARHYFRQFRRVLLRRFPFKIFYQLVGDRVIVFRVLHAKQDHEFGLQRP